MEKLAVIGAGLCGLYTAYLLRERYAVTVFEARPRIGGRIHSVDGHDLGPSWIWPHQHRILSLAQHLKLELFAQYDKGAALYETPQGVQLFTPPPSAPSGRMAGGMMRLAEALGNAVEAKIALDERVVSLSACGNGVEVGTTRARYGFDKVVCTLPPRLAEKSIAYEPPLPACDALKMRSVPTWMGHTAKCVITFEMPFWRSKGLSGFCFSAVGPLAEIHDACTPQNAALFGFVGANADMAGIEEDVRTQLLRLFGDDALAVKSFHCVDWRQERLTAVAADAAARTAHPEYGLELAHFGERLFFTGTEHARQEGGYLEGALNAALRVAERCR